MNATKVLTASLSSDVNDLAERLDEVLVTVKSRAGGGSGTSWSADGLVVTNQHVVPNGSAVVVLRDGSEFEATVEERDPEHDLALLRVNATLTPATAADSTGVRPGSLAFAIGNPWGQRGTLTSGVIFSAGGATDEGLRLGDVIRADLRLAPGNSGGPMTDARGHVIGINSMIAGGMAIAVPVRHVEELVARSEPGEPGFLGISFQPIQVPHAIAASYQVDDETALMLTAIEPGSAAERAGLIPGDIVLGAGDGRRGLRHLSQPFRSMRANKPMRLSLLRGGRLVDVAATPQSRS